MQRSTKIVELAIEALDGAPILFGHRRLVLRGQCRSPRVRPMDEREVSCQKCGPVEAHSIGDPLDERVGVVGDSYGAIGIGVWEQQLAAPVLTSRFMTAASRRKSRAGNRLRPSAARASPRSHMIGRGSRNAPRLSRKTSDRRPSPIAAATCRLRRSLSRVDRFMTAPVEWGCLPDMIDVQDGKVRANGVIVSEKTTDSAKNSLIAGARFRPSGAP